MNGAARPQTIELLNSSFSVYFNNPSRGRVLP